MEMKMNKATLFAILLIFALVISVSAVSAAEDSDDLIAINDIDDNVTLEDSADEALTTDEHSNGEGYIKFDSDSITMEEGQKDKNVTGTLQYCTGGQYYDYYGAVNVNCTYTDGNGVARDYVAAIDDEGKLNFNLNQCEGLIASDNPYILTFKPIEDDNGYGVYLVENDNNPLANSWVSLTVTAPVPVEDDPMMIYVGPNGVDADGYGGKDNPYKTIKYATTKAIDNQKIFIYEGTYTEAAINLASKPYRNLTFIGENRNVIIKGSTSGRTFDTGSTKFSVYLKFINITVIDAKSGTSNAIFDLRQNTGTNEFINCTIKDSEGIYGIYSGGITLMDGCEILNHIVTRANGYGIWISSDGEHYITNTMINGVTKTASSAGYVISASKGILNINNLTMTSVNGIIYGINLATNSNANVIITNSKFTDNAFQGTYSALFNGGSKCDFTITNSVIANNKVTTGLIKGSSSYSNLNYNLNYNLIYNNTDYNDNTKPGNTISYANPTANTDYNYWGSNTPGLIIAGETVTPNNWIVIDVENTPNALRHGETVTVTAQLKVNDTEGTLKEFDGTLPEIPVTLQYNGETVDKVLSGSTPAQASFTFDKNNPTLTVKAINQMTAYDIPVFKIYVGPNGSDETGDGSKDNPYKTIKYAVSQALDNDVINILEGRYDEDSISLTKSLTFLGENENVVITSSAAKKVFDAAYSETAGNFDLRFEKLTFDSINSGSFNAILNLRNTGKTEIIDCSFENTIGQYNIWSASPETVIENCEFKNIAYTSAGSIIYSSGSNGKQELKNITFDKITSSASGTVNLIYTMNVQEINIDTLRVSGVSGKFNGLSIANKNNVTIKNAEIINNEFKKQSDAAGGSIFSIAGSGNLEVTDSIIANNTIERGIAVGTSNETVLTLNYNLIYNNVGNIIYSGVKTKPVQYYDINYNFWGDNNKPVLTTNVGEVNINNWIVVETSHYPGAVLDGKEVLVSAQLKVKDDEGIEDLEKAFMELPITFKYNGNETSALIVDNSAEYTITFNSSEENITIDVMDAELTETIEVKDPINYVSPTGNDTTGDGTPNRPFKTISKAVETAEDGFTIYLLEGTYDENSIALTKNLVFIGENAVITSSNKNNKIFTSGSINTNYKFVNLTFSSNNADSSEVTILELQNKGKNEFENCKFENLTVKTIIESYAETIISNCEFNDNVVNYGSGSVGTQLIYLRGANATIVNTNITKNSYTPSSNYVFLIYTRGTTLMDNVLIAENTGRTYGIYAYDSTVDITDSRIINNNLQAGANDGKSGGVIFTVQSRASTFNVTNTLISDNQLAAGIAYGNNKNALFVLNYNVIANNTGKLTLVGTNKPTFDFNCNYWGSNTKPTEVNIDKWVIVETSHAPDKVNDGANITVIAQLKVIDNENYIKDLERSIPEMEITFEYNGESVISTITNEAESVFTTELPEENVTVTLIDEKLIETLDITPVMHIYVNDTWIKLDNPVFIQGSKVPITLKINGETVLENQVLSEGKLTYIIPSEDLILGENDVTVVFGKETLTTSETFEAHRIKPTISIETSEVTICEDVIVTVKVENATGDVTFIVGGTQKVVTLDNSVATFTIPEIRAGTHIVTASYSGDKDYEKGSIQTVIEVNKLNSTIIIETTELNIGEDVNVTVTIEGATGEVTLIVDGARQTLALDSGVAKYTINAITAGKHYATAIYMGDEIYGFAINTSNFYVEKLSSEIDLKDITADWGIAVPIKFTIGDDATGRVLFDLDGKKFFNDLIDGGVDIELTDLAKGTYTLSITYKGDEKYNPCEKTIQIMVNGLDADLKADASDIIVGEDAIVNIEIDSTASGTVVAILDDEYPVNIFYGKGSVAISGLADGTYTVTVKFAGDNKFNASETTASFTVSKKELPNGTTNVTMDIPEGTTSPEFSIKLPSDATGNFTVTVDGKDYTESLVNGSATVKVPDLTVGNHAISTSYTGDDNYEGFTSGAKTVDIPKASIPGGENAINMTSPADSATPSYSIKLPADAKGNLTVTVDGKTNYTEALINGSATVKVPELAAGTHKITVTYSGDDKYSSISKNTSVNVPKKATHAPKKTKVATKIIAKNKKFKAKKKVKKYTITLKTKAGKAIKNVQVTIKIGKKTYKAKTNAKGKATFKIKKLTKKGKYKAVIKFKGNANYKACSKKVKITIKK